MSEILALLSSFDAFVFGFLPVELKGNLWVYCCDGLVTCLGVKFNGRCEAGFGLY